MKKIEFLASKSTKMIPTLEENELNTHRMRELFKTLFDVMCIEKDYVGISQVFSISNRVVDIGSSDYDYYKNRFMSSIERYKGLAELFSKYRAFLIL